MNLSVLSPPQDSIEVEPEIVTSVDERSDSSQRASSSANKTKQGVLQKTLLTALIGIAFFTFAALLGRMHWLLELISHFRWQYLFAAGIVMLSLFMLRKYRLAGIAGVLVAVNSLFVLPVYFASPDTVPEGTRTVRVLYCNVLIGNRQFEDMKKMVREYDPDIVLFAETHQRWIRRLGDLKTDYPYTIAEPHQGAFGIAGFSRIETDDLQIVTLGENPVPAVVVKTEVNGEPLTLIAAHVESPGTAASLRGRCQHMDALAALVKRQTTPTAVIGDLNISPWSPYFGDFLESTNLRDSRAGFGNQHSWPALPTFLTPLQIPIDHCLVSERVVVSKREIGPFVGSDHYPLIVELSVKADDEAGRD